MVWRGGVWSWGTLCWGSLDLEQWDTTVTQATREDTFTTVVTTSYIYHLCRVEQLWWRSPALVPPAEITYHHHREGSHNTLVTGPQEPAVVGRLARCPPNTGLGVMTASRSLVSSPNNSHSWTRISTTPNNTWQHIRLNNLISNVSETY